MTDHLIHPGHHHDHGPRCGHLGVKHHTHIDYLHEGHLHTMHAGHVDECMIEVDVTNPEDCTPGHACGGHGVDHEHTDGCGHPMVPHGDHVDFLVRGHLHHPHGDHCDDHGPLRPA